MFERVITQTIQRISSEVLRDRQSIPLTEILEDERIPARFKPFFATEVRWWLYNDALARSANKRFDFAHPEVSSLLDYLEQVMFRHARFEHDEFVSTLDSAVKLTFNYLCRPQTTLKWYIFRGQPVKPLSEVMLRFESFLDYEYIGNVFAEWVDRKVRERATFEAISATEFERIIRRIDDQILLSCTVDELLGLLDPIFDFIGEGDEHTVPLDALIIFFDDKNIARLVDHLDRYRQPNAIVTRDRFVGILEELLTSAEENPEADFSSVYQNDELDDIVQRHLEAEGKLGQRGGEEPAFEQPFPDHDIVAPSPAFDTSTARPETFEPERAELVTQSPEPPPPAAEPSPAAAPPAVQTGDTVGPSATETHAHLEPAAVPIVTETERPAPASATPSPVLEEKAADEAAVPFTEERSEGNVGRAFAEGARSIEEPASISDVVSTLEESSATVEEVAENRSDDRRDQASADVATDSHPQMSVDSSEGLTSSSSASREEGTQPRKPTGEHEAAPVHEPVAPGEPLPAREPDAASQPAPTAARPSAPEAKPATRPVSTDEAQRAAVSLDPLLERKVLKKVFNRDRAAYDDAMRRLADAATWRQASQVLDELFIRYDVDPYSRTALRFTDSIYTRYVPRTGG